MIDLYESRFCILFPGQGAQFAGMVNKLRRSTEAQEIFRKGEEILGYPIKNLMDTGKAEVLDHTRHAQPAVFLASYAYLIAFRKYTESLEIPNRPFAYCGHSLGQITALVAAGALGFEDGVELVRRRAKWMDEASLERPGLMAAVLGLDFQTACEIQKKASGHGILNIANFNGPAQYVFSGEKAAVLRVAEEAEKARAKKVVVLRVTTASHSPLMQSAQKKFSEYTETISIREANTPVILNTSAELTTSESAIRDELKKHLCLPVQWEKSIERLANSKVDLFLDMGPGAVLEKLVQHQLPNANIASLGFLQSIEKMILPQASPKGRQT